MELRLRTPHPTPASLRSLNNMIACSWVLGQFAQVKHLSWIWLILLLFFMPVSPPRGRGVPTSIFRVQLRGRRVGDLLTAALAGDVYVLAITSGWSYCQLRFQAHPRHRLCQPTCVEAAQGRAAGLLVASVQAGQENRSEWTAPQTSLGKLPITKHKDFQWKIHFLRTLSRMQSSSALKRMLANAADSIVNTACMFMAVKFTRIPTFGHKPAAMLQRWRLYEQTLCGQPLSITKH